MAQESFGNRVFRARMQLAATRGKAVTQAKIAAALGVAVATVSSWETGGKEPDRETIRRLADFLGVAPAWLAWGEGEATKPASALEPDLVAAHARALADAHARDLQRQGVHPSPERATPRKRRA